MSGLPPREPANLRDIWNAGPTEPDYLVPNLLGRGEVCLLAGAPESGKTMLLAALAAAVAAGGEVFAEFPATAPSRVLYLDEEIGQHEFVRRLRMLAAGMCLNLDLLHDNLLLFPQQGYSLHTDERIDEFHRSVSVFDPKLIIVDTFVSVYGGDENDNSAVRQWFDRVVTPLRVDDRSVVVSHHLNKDREDDRRSGRARIRGATDLYSYPDRVWMARRSNERASTTGAEVLQTRLSTIKSRRGKKQPSIPVEFRSSEDGNRIVLSCADLTPTTAARRGKVRTCKQVVLQRLQSQSGSCERKALYDIPEQLGCSRKALDRALNALESDGRIRLVSENGSSVVTLAEVLLPS
jgi:hypothetical protein